VGDGEGNWDYRYAWVRDSTFALWGLYTLGFDREAPHLSGYEGATPVRVGNAAFRQKQHDVWGAGALTKHGCRRGSGVTEPGT